MVDPARQLVFDLPLAPRFGREDFLVSPSNEAAYGAIEAWPDWPNGFLHLVGPRGSGKSHLAAIWAARSGAAVVPAVAISDDLVPGLASGRPLVVEDLDRGPVDEPSLFHLVNLAREGASHILLTSTRALDEAVVATADLRSRLRLAPSVLLGPPDDALLRAVLVKLFLDRQLVVDTAVVDYLATRMERSLAGAVAIVADLDQEALSRGRRVTRPVAADVIARHTDAAEGES